MIKLFYCHIADVLDDEAIPPLISTFSVLEQAYFSAIEHKGAQRRTLFGRIIVRYISAQLGIAWAGCLRLERFGKPVFAVPNGFDFNISHAGDMVVCCLSEGASVGIDVERNRPLDIGIYRAYFDEQEWQWIEQSETPELAFLKAWVRKEAVAKADGRGVALEWSSFNGLGQTATVGPNTYFLQDVDLMPGYTCAIACDKKKTVQLIDFKEIFLTENTTRVWKSLISPSLG